MQVFLRLLDLLIVGIHAKKHCKRCAMTQNVTSMENDVPKEVTGFKM